MKRNSILSIVAACLLMSLVSLAASDTPKRFRWAPVLPTRNWLFRPNGWLTTSPIQIW